MRKLKQWGGPLSYAKRVQQSMNLKLNDWTRAQAGIVIVTTLLLLLIVSFPPVGRLRTSVGCAYYPAEFGGFPFLPDFLERPEGPPMHIAWPILLLEISAVVGATRVLWLLIEEPYR
jgi:hypothetical protein